MLPSRNLCSKFSNIAFRAHLSSKANRFDPRTEELKRTLLPWEYAEGRKRTSFIRKLEPTASLTDMSKFFLTPIDLRREKINSWWKKKTYQSELAIQKFDIGRLDALGSDISAGHALLDIGASIQFKGKSWLKSKQIFGSEKLLPILYEEGWILEAIDLTECPVHYEGLLNLQNLNNVHTLILHKCPYIDDWCLDYISSQILGLENLNLSGCLKVTPRCVSALTRLPNLKRLDLSDCPAFQSHEGILACMLLEDCNPKLEIIGVAPADEIPVDLNDSVNCENRSIQS